MKKFNYKKEVIQRVKVERDNGKSVFYEEKVLETIEKQVNIFEYVRRVYYDISQDKFGSFFGLEKQQVSSLETGRTKITKIHVRALISILEEDGYDTSVVFEYLKNM